MHAAFGPIGVQLPDEAQRLLVHLLGGLGHVDRKEPGGDALIDEATAPRVRMVDDDRLHAQSSRALEDEALAGVAGGHEHHGGASGELPAQLLRLGAVVLQERLRNAAQHLARRRGRQGPDRGRALRRPPGLRQAAWRGQQLLHLELRACDDLGGVAGDLAPHPVAVKVLQDALLGSPTADLPSWRWGGPEGRRGMHGLLGGPPLALVPPPEGQRLLDGRDLAPAAAPLATEASKAAAVHARHLGAVAACAGGPALRWHCLLRAKI
mmetsp:Transcript_11135/g.30340  ORF Transcript_11135/g.30340 Transcript_11135/m.30340 type:complete len:266 (+) Transcript_11135:1077-1874(+)